MMLWLLTVLASSMLVMVSNGETIQYDHFQLPKSVRPEHYKLQLATHLNDDKGFEYSGYVAITIIAEENTKNITLHSKNLTINSEKIMVKTLKHDKIAERSVKDVQLIQKHDYYVMILSEPLIKGGKYLISIPFKSELSKNLFGYYRSSYKDQETGEIKWLSITQFEPAGARLAFPCFDEPEIKAKFTIILDHDKKYTALSNMPLKSTTALKDNSEWVTDEFEESIPMSTYLVAYSINDFKFEETMVDNSTQVVFRTWARKDAMSQVDYAGEVGPKVLKFYEHKFDIPFPLPKVDQIAIPDFSAGAMENWGLVTYRETALLFAKNVSSTTNKYRVAEVISHELAHQWFGNLVTMKWWTDLWLNEGFATYVASVGVQYLHPEWDSLKGESVDNTLSIFSIDSLKSSHPVSVEIGHASQISQIFDSISYSKGSCVIRMMHLFLGDTAFWNGITAYLKKYAYKNAEQNNLWEALTKTAHKLKTIPKSYNIKEIMDSWTLQTGYPIITIERDYTKGSANLIQNRYLRDTTEARNKPNGCWWVPLSYTTESELDFNNTQPKKWLECKNMESVPLTIENIANNSEWIIFNVQLSGLYKVKYDEKNWDLLIKTLTSVNFKQIHVMNRAHLIDDALSLAWTGDQDYSIAMRILEYLRQEKEYIPWRSALDNLGTVNRMMRMTSDYHYFKKYMQKILEPIYESLEGLNDTLMNSERLDAVQHKIMIANWACKFEVGDCVEKAKEYFREWQQVENPDEYNPIPLNLRSVVYCNAIRNGYEIEWEFLWARYKRSNVAAERQTILSALGCTREIWILQRYIGWCFDENSAIRKQDSFIVFSSIARSDIGFHLARDYFISNIKEIYNYFNPETTRLGRLFGPIAEQMNTKREFNMMKKFTETHKKFLENASESIKRSLETIEINSQWKAKRFSRLTSGLQNFL